jgi:hypothetical protein
MIIYFIQATNNAQSLSTSNLIYESRLNQNNEEQDAAIAEEKQK